MEERGSDDGYDPLDHVADFGLAALHVWQRAVEVQSCRVLDEAARRLDAQVDGLLLVLALRQVLRAATLIAETTDDGRQGVIRAAVERFHSANPDLKNARDVIDHFDDYLRGRGKLSHPGMRRSDVTPTSEAAAQFTVYYERGESGHYVLHLGELRVDVGSARESARLMCDEISDVFYRPVSPEVALEVFGPLDCSNPAAVALAFTLELTREVFDEPARDRARSFATPESQSAWGDFEEARREVAGHALASRPAFPNEDVAYVQLIPGEQALSVVSEPLVVPDSLVVTLQRRVDLDGTWRVHQIGPPVPPKALPRPGA